MMNKIGCLWIKKSKDGKQYFSGMLSDMRGDFPVVAFRNEKKEKENQPDFLVYVSEPIKEEKGEAIEDIQVEEKPIEKKKSSEEPPMEEEAPLVGDLPY